MVNPVSSVSTLIEPVEAGEKTLKVAKRDDWSTETRLRGLAIGAEADYSDLPNSHVITMDRIDDAGDVYEILLRKPLEQPLKTETQVRVHRYADYPRVWDNTLPAEWTHMSFTLLPDFVPGERPRHTSWPGAAYISVVVRNHYTNYPEKLPEGEQPPVLLFNEITVTESDAQGGDSSQ